MNWFGGIAKLMFLDGEAEEPFNETLEYTATTLTKILDKVFLLHYRKSNNKMVNEAIDQMNSVR